MAVKQVFDRQKVRSVYHVAISTKLNNYSTKKPKDEPLFITMERDNKLSQQTTKKNER